MIHPTPAEFFFDRHYEQEPLLVRRSNPDYFRGLLSLDDVDRIITTLDARYADICLVNADRKIEIEEYTNRDDSIDIAQVFGLHGDGATIILNHLHRRHAPLADLCAALELEFSAPFQTNIYMTPPRAKGFKAHFDTHNVFVLQLAGSKRWRFYGTPVCLPLKGQGEEAAQADPGPATEAFELHPGDSLYIPRGLVHDALAGDDTSLHVTVGALAYTWSDLILEAVAGVILKDADFRRSLPHGFAKSGFERRIVHDIFARLVGKLSRHMEVDDVLDGLIEQFIDGRRPRLRGQFSQLDGLDNLTLRTKVACRPTLAYSLLEDESAIHLHCYGKEISFPKHAGAALRHALENRSFEVRALPGELDEAGKLVLVRRLVREGVLGVVEVA